MTDQISRFLRHLGAALALAVTLVFSASVPTVSADAEAPDQIVGEIDLSSWDFEANKLASLAGEWTVFRGQILAPAQAVVLRGETGEKTSIPDVWGPAFTTTLASGYGSATYVVRVQVPEGAGEMALGPLNMRLIEGIYAHVPDAAGGKIYRLTHSANPLLLSDVHPNAIPLPFLAARFDLIFQLTNNVHKQGGVIQAPEIGPRRYVEATVGSRRAANMSIVVLLGMMALAGASIGLVVRDRRVFFFFAFLAAAAAGRTLTTGLIMVDFFPDISIARKYDLEYLSFFLFPPAAYAFFASLFPEDNFRTFQRIIYGLTAPLVLFALVGAPWLTPGSVTLLREPAQLLAIALIIGSCALSLKAFKNQRRDSGIALTSVLVMAIAATIEFSFYTGFQPKIVQASHVGLVIVGMLFTGSMILRFGRFQAERDAMNVRLKEQTGQLKIANQKATAGSKAKSDFLAVLSHEIRTPLTGMIGMTGVLEKEVPNAEHSRLMAAVRRSGEGLLGMLNDMLDLSKIEAGAVEIEKTPFTLGQLIEQINDLWQSPMQEKNLAFAIDCSYPADKPLVGDVGRIRQILHNLIGNARKFTDSGSVTVEIGGHEMNDDLVQLDLSVIDTGIGVPADKQEQIFGMFNQADSSTSRNYGGTGLGLALCKQFAEMMGGSIGLKSAPGKGSTFNFTISCEIGTVIEEEDAPAETTAITSRALRILVAEDVPLNQEVIRRMLGSMGHDVTIVGDGQEAVNTCKEAEYDLVLMDLQMPELDGISAARMIRSLSNHMSNAPIFALTATVGDEVRREIETAGMNGLVAKPIELSEVRDVINAVIAEDAAAGTGLMARQKSGAI